jgi:hypothetical protein
MITVICAIGDERVDKYFQAFKTTKVRFIHFSERELKRLKDVDLHNWITMDNLVAGKHKIFKRAVTAYLIADLKAKNSKVFERKEILKDVSLYLYNHIVKLEDYHNDYYCSAEPDLIAAMLELAEDKKLFDPFIYDVYKETKFTLEKLPFMQYLLSLLTYYASAETTEAMVKYMKDLCKYHKYKMDWENYKLPIIEEKVEPKVELELEETI